MFDIVLIEPEIPPNTGNIIRLCANTGCRLHLIEPLGFELSDQRLRRAGLDYHEYAQLTCYPDLESFLDRHPQQRHYLFTTHSRVDYSEARFQPNDALVFGAETRGVSKHYASYFPPECQLRIPMLKSSRSLNLSNSVAIALYEAWRQNRFEGSTQLADSPL